MNKVQLLKHPINYHVAQINFEADTTQELGDWIDQYPPPIASEGIGQGCHTEEQHRKRIATYCKISNCGNQQNRSSDNLVLRCKLSQFLTIEEDQATSDKVNRIVDNIQSRCKSNTKCIRSSPFASSFNSSIKESVSLEPPAITSFLSVLTFLKASTRYRIPFSGTRRPRNNM